MGANYIFKSFRDITNMQIKGNGPTVVQKWNEETFKKVEALYLKGLNMGITINGKYYKCEEFCNFTNLLSLKIAPIIR